MRRYADTIDRTAAVTGGRGRFCLVPERSVGPPASEVKTQHAEPSASRSVGSGSLPNQDRASLGGNATRAGFCISTDPVLKGLQAQSRAIRAQRGVKHHAERGT